MHRSIFSIIWMVNILLSYAQEMQNIVPGAYIVEFSSSFKRLRTNNHHELFYQRMPRMNAAVTPALNFTSSIFMGVSLRLNHPDDLFVIKTLDSVANVWPVTLYPRPRPIIENIINVSKLAENETAENQFSIHVMTGVDKLHAQGYVGTDVRIAVIDSGVDYRHPALGGGFGPGYKIQFGRDLVGDNYTGLNLPNPDDDPMDCGGHGTHVTGIIGAEDPLFTGVAPNATLGMYRVFGCVGSVANDVLIAALTQAYADGAQIISASLGATSGWANSPLPLIASEIAKNGVYCVMAAGNSGTQGLFYASGPANGDDVISVGSVTNIVTPTMAIQGQFTVDTEPDAISFSYIPSTIAFPSNISGYPLYALDLDTSNPADACTELPSNTTSLAGKIILIRRGTCSFITKIENVQRFGAQFVIFYTNESPPSRPQTDFGVLAAMVSADQGAEWITYLKERLTVNLHFADDPLTGVIYSPNTIAGGTMSTFSSWSPTYELNIKPEVSAPGGNILSTIPMTAGSYGISSGTSMATPYISGVLALYMEAHGLNTTLDYQILRQILSTTSTPLPFNDGMETFPYLAPVIQQGGGLVNAYAAVHYTTLISPSILPLNDSTYSKQTVTFTISNNDPTTVSYTLTHKPAATVYTLGVNTTFPQSFPPDLITENATVTISPDNLTIPAQSSATINVIFLEPSMLETERIPVFSGYINIQSSKNESFHLPYAGVACNMKEVMITDFERRSPYISRYRDLDPIPHPVENDTIFDVTTDPPMLNWRMVMGSSVVRIDILGDGNQTEVLGVNILGTIPGYPRYWTPRNALTNTANRYYAFWTGSLDTGEQVPAGTYQFLYRALKIFGDPNNNNDYENWISHPFGIVYEPLLSNLTSTVIPTTLTTASTITGSTTTSTAGTTTVQTISTSMPMVTTSTAGTTTVQTTSTPMPMVTTTTTSKAHSSSRYSIRFSIFLIILCFFRIR